MILLTKREFLYREERVSNFCGETAAIAVLRIHEIKFNDFYFREVMITTNFDYFLILQSES